MKNAHRSSENDKSNTFVRLSLLLEEYVVFDGILLTDFVLNPSNDLLESCLLRIRFLFDFVGVLTSGIRGCYAFSCPMVIVLFTFVIQCLSQFCSQVLQKY